MLLLQNAFTPCEGNKLVLTFPCIDYSCYYSIIFGNFSDGRLHIHIDSDHPFQSLNAGSDSEIAACISPAAKWFGFDRISEAHQYFLSTLPPLCTDNMLAEPKKCANKYMLSSSQRQVAHDDEGIGFHQHLWQDYPLLWCYFPPFYFCFYASAIKSAVIEASWLGPHWSKSKLSHMWAVKTWYFLFLVIYFFASVFHDWHLRLRGLF